MQAVQSLTADDVQRLVDDHPLSVETWPLWRDFYIRLFFIDAGEPEEFYDRLNEFHSEASQAEKPSEWESDAIVWVIRTNERRRRAVETNNMASAMEAAEKALSLGDPEGISSMNLAIMIIQQAALMQRPHRTSVEFGLMLADAENHLASVSQKSPQAKLTAWYGLIACLRGDRAKGISLLEKAADERPSNEWIAIQYIQFALPNLPDNVSKSQLTQKFIQRHPQSSDIYGLHAVALHLDGSFAAAAETLHQARSLGDAVNKRFPPEMLREIERDADLEPDAAEGLKAFRQERFDLATLKLREAWNKSHDNPSIAKGLMFSQLKTITSPPKKSHAKEMIKEFAEISAQFPNDGELQVGYGVALAYASDFAAAQRAFDRGQALGADLESMVGQKGLRDIARLRDEQAERQAVDDAMNYAVIGSLGFAGVLLVWIGVMFVAGMLLAVSIPRTPSSSQVSKLELSRREIWLERFYLVALSLSLLLFYISVPFVAAGILVVTLCLVGLLLVLRVLHYGLLYRGCWPVWHMLRLVFLGSSSDLLGIEVNSEQHPKLFEELQSVADRIETPVINRVFLVPGAQVAVRQEGAGPFGLLGRRNRVLQLGVSILPWLTMSEFRSILAHEYAHFSHRDPFFGRFIFQVNASLFNSLSVMQAAAGSLNYVNPFYGLYWLYLRAYNLLSAGYSRSREFLADRRALSAYGRQPFVSGLTKIYQEGELFDAFAVNNIQQLLAANSEFVNVFDSYRDYRELPEAAEIRSNLLEHARQRKSNWFDSHPTYLERLTAAECFPISEEYADPSSALELLSSSREVEESLTRILTDRLHHQMETGG